MRLIHQVAEAVRYRHRVLSRTWIDATAPPSFRPLPEGMPSSYGQCVPSSIILLDELRYVFPGEEMRLAEGRVLSVSKKAGKTILQKIIPEHTWIDWQHPNWNKICVIDVTSGQAEGRRLPPYLVASHDELYAQNIIYQTYRTFDSEASFLAMNRQIDPSSTLPARVELLQKLFDCALL